MHLWEIHPALVYFPIVFFFVGAILDLYGTWRGRIDLARIGQQSLALGLATGLVAAFFGVLAFLTVPMLDANYRSYLGWHFALNAFALAAFAVPVITRWGSRWVGANRYALVAEVLGIVLLVIGGAVGHALVVRGGAGVRPDLLGPKALPRVTPAAAAPGAR